jgi:hypothetical protein
MLAKKLFYVRKKRNEMKMLRYSVWMDKLYCAIPPVEIIPWSGLRRHQVWWTNFTVQSILSRYFRGQDCDVIRFNGQTVLCYHSCWDIPVVRIVTSSVLMDKLYCAINPVEIFPWAGLWHHQVWWTVLSLLLRYSRGQDCDVIDFCLTPNLVFFCNLNPMQNFRTLR